VCVGMGTCFPNIMCTEILKFIVYCDNIMNYSSDDEVKAAVKSWIREKSEEFFSDGMKKICYMLGEMC
jgi:hypothetical protein